MLKNLRENRKKGFTLVELIVVLVILAILAALLIPALTGYIDKAKEKQIIAETRQAVMAAQTLVDEEYGILNLGSTTEIKIVDSYSGASGAKASGEILKSDVAALAEVKSDNIKSIEIGKSADGDMYGKIKEVVYERDKKKCTYTKKDTTTAGTYVIEAAATSNP